MNNQTVQNELQSPEVAKQKQMPKQKAIWQKPRVQRLRISIDTAFGTGSNVDVGRPSP